MKIALALIAFLANPSLAFAQDPVPESEPPPALVVVPRLTLFNADIRGRVRADEGTGPPAILDGTSVNFASDLDLDDSDPVWVFEIAAFHRGEGRCLERASLSYLDASYEGSSTLDSAEAFNGWTFPAGTQVESKCRYRSWGADFAIVDGDSPFEDTSGSILMGMRYTDLRVLVEGGGQGTDERLRLFYLGVGARGESRWGGWLSAILQGVVYFSMGGFNDGFDLEFENWGGILFEGMAGVSGSIGPLHLEAGWRLISNTSYSQVDTSDKFEENDFSILLSGPYFSATLRF